MSRHAWIAALVLTVNACVEDSTADEPAEEVASTGGLDTEVASSGGFDTEVGGTTERTTGAGDTDAGDPASTGTESSGTEGGDSGDVPLDPSANAYDPRDPACFSGEPKPRAGGATADEIPVANTPSFPDGTCGFDDWPGLYLTECTEPLVEGAADHRGLWQAVSGNVGRVLRVEQCGNRVTIVGGIAGEETKHSVHDMRMDGTVENGVNDINVQTCMPLVAVTQFEDGVTQALYPPGGTQPAVTRTLVDGRIVENRPSDGLVSEFVRICRLPIAPD